MLNTPCHDCPRHSPGCHVGCKAYAEYQKANAEYRRNRDLEQYLNRRDERHNFDNPNRRMK